MDVYTCGLKSQLFFKNERLFKVRQSRRPTP